MPEETASVSALARYAVPSRRRNAPTGGASTIYLRPAWIPTGKYL